jgi:hypothetical protein
MSTTAAPELSAEQVQELLRELKSADSVELKLTIPEYAQRSTVAALGIDPLEAQLRLVYFFDTPELALDEKGVVVRARRIQGKGEDSIVKLRPVDPASVPEELRVSSSFRVEVDALPGGFVCSATMKGTPKKGDVQKVAQGEKALKKLLSKEQRAFLAEHVDGIALEDLKLLGPIFVLKLRFTPKDFDRRLVAEMWLYPDGSRVLELSTRCETSEAFQAAAELRAFFATHGVEVTGEQATKTRKALTYFARGLKEEA